MKPTNHLTFDQARTFQEGIVAELPIDDVVSLQDDLEARAESLKTDHELFKRILDIRFNGMAQSAYSGAGKDTGKIAVSIDPRYDLVMSRSKRVDWDQDGLAALYTKIEQAGDRPDTYIKRTVTTIYTVPEASYKLWAAEIQGAFAQYRIVRAGETKISIQPKEKK